ncbi:MAG: acyl-CoA reductase [Bacilli bacterium]|nr:acyl-CoA reductase [Bacilli bacterium]
MILYQGNILEDHKQKEMLLRLKQDCYDTLANTEALQLDEVINACDQLAQLVKSRTYDELILPLLEEFDIPYDYFINHIPMFEKASLLRKVSIELGEQSNIPSDLDEDNEKAFYPLGILFHIAAGNVDVLPAYSVIEGLLAGNINILKLPSGDRGVSVKLLSELIRIEPKLKPYIYVFDVPSTETETLKLFADIADAIVVWGGDVAIKAARSMASVTTKIIEWGHKLSFAYATLDSTDKDLEALAHHMAMTDQVLCSSAQGIFIDTDSREALDAFAERFFNIFVSVNKQHKPIPFGMKSKNALQLYYEQLQQNETNKKIWKKDGISVTTSDDSELELSMMFRSIWVKMLPRKQLIHQLKPHKSHLQTVGLLASDSEFEELKHLLIQAGVTRITKPGDMSRMIVGESHDGVYPLRLYSRVVESCKSNKIT